MQKFTTEILQKAQFNCQEIRTCITTGQTLLRIHQQTDHCTQLVTQLSSKESTRCMCTCTRMMLTSKHTAETRAVWDYYLLPQTRKHISFDDSNSLVNTALTATHNLTTNL